MLFAPPNSPKQPRPDPVLSRIVRATAAHPVFTRMVRSPTFSRMVKSPHFARMVRSPLGRHLTLSRMVRSPHFARMVRWPNFSRMGRSPHFARVVRSPNFSRMVRPCCQHFNRAPTSREEPLEQRQGLPWRQVAGTS